MTSIKMTEQFGGADFEKVEDHGLAELERVLGHFDQKPWHSEAVTAAQTEMCAPTLSLEDPTSDKLFWVSAYLAGDKLRFVNEYRYPIESPGWLSKLRGKTHESPRTRELTEAEAREALALFMGGKHDALLKHL
ncbi:MAG: hypothetical protein AAF680_00065 [Pseudomonadota bacterium]